MVRPDELKAEHDSEAQIASAALEAQFDSSLRKSYEGAGREISIQRPQGVKAHVLNSVVDKYRTAGWTVKYHSDQRDGDYLTFAHYEKQNDR